MSAAIATATAGAVGFVLTVGFGWWHARTATSTTPPIRIVTFELAGSGLGAFDLLTRLGHDGRRLARRCLAIDSGIIVGYVIAFAGFGVSAAVAASHRSTGGTKAIGIATGFTAAACGALGGSFDLFENANLRNVLAAWHDPNPDASALASAEAGPLRRAIGASMQSPARRATASARTKFILLTIGLVSIAGAWTVVYAAR